MTTIATSSMSFLSQVPTSMLAQTTAFVVIWILLHRHVSRHGPIPGASSLCKFHNRSYSLASFLLLLLILSPNHELAARRAYHYSKFYEYIDILSVRASGGQIGLHFGFHHLTTSYWTLFRVMNESLSDRGWVVFAASNAFHHVLMYAYFGGATFVRPFLPWTGGLQLVNGILTEMVLAGEKRLKSGGSAEMKMRPVIWPHVFAAGLLGAYLVLFTRDLKLGGDSKKKKKEA